MFWKSEKKGMRLATTNAPMRKPREIRKWFRLAALQAVRL